MALLLTRALGANPSLRWSPRALLRLPLWQMQLRLQL